MTNYASEDQMLAVAQSCRHFNSGGMINSRLNTAAEGISCRLCKNWDGKHCMIDVFDNVLTSMDQT
jgi:hypothetical protein